MRNYYKSHKLLLLSVAFTAASLMGGAKVEAQTTGTADNSDGSAIKGVDKLAGSDPASLKVTEESQYTNNDPAHVFFLYNVGLKKFVGNGGSRTMKGIYNLQEERLRDGSSTQGLPSGLYIVNGKITMIR